MTDQPNRADALLPCPFCGGADLSVDDDGESGVQVSCNANGCGAIGPGSSNRRPRLDNVELWNRRVAPVQGVKVRALEWHADPYNEGDYCFFRARAGDYIYEVGANASWWWQEDGAANLCATDGFETSDAAKAAAQADYEARILAALEPAPVMGIPISENAEAQTFTPDPVTGFRFDIRSALASALEPAEAQGWQTDMENAPRIELEDIIVFNGTIVQCAQWWEGGWVDSLSDWIDPQPTHWMPLPAPPAAQEGR